MPVLKYVICQVKNNLQKRTFKLFNDNLPKTFLYDEPRAVEIFFTSITDVTCILCRVTQVIRV